MSLSALPCNFHLACTEGDPPSRLVEAASKDAPGSTRKLLPWMFKMLKHDSHDLCASACWSMSGALETFSTTGLCMSTFRLMSAGKYGMPAILAPIVARRLEHSSEKKNIPGTPLRFT
mmetsp:Transcript_13940/g.20816  ORF Transcript_13940/g.20816 Transcript_13940/m.20816 type:complete len:118 (+) Transcript_13940:738-1091(+)